MGGNAIKTTPVKRLDAAEYWDLTREILERLRASFPFRFIKDIKAYKNKPDFGDLDVLFEYNPCDNIDLVAYIKDELKSKEVVPNGNVISFEYKEFQVDLIKAPLTEYDASYNYFSYNDLGNLLGRVAHAHGMKLGHDGLSYMYRDGDYVFDKIVVSRDWKVILPLFGYDYDTWAKGFENLEDIFKFVTGSKYFSPQIYLLHNVNSVARIRDAKRKTYTAFLDYCRTLPEESETVKYYDYGKEYSEYDDVREYHLTKARFLQRLSQDMPEFGNKLMIMHGKYRNYKEAKTKFNGDLVRAWTGLDGKELGELMKAIREGIGNKDQLQYWSLHTTEEEKKQLVKEVQQRLG